MCGHCASVVIKPEKEIIAQKIRCWKCYPKHSAIIDEDTILPVSYSGTEVLIVKTREDSSYIEDFNLTKQKRKKYEKINEIHSENYKDIGCVKGVVDVFRIFREYVNDKNTDNGNWKKINESPDFKGTFKELYKKIRESPKYEEGYREACGENNFRKKKI